jgi:hypothetical protein
MNKACMNKAAPIALAAMLFAAPVQAQEEAIERDARPGIVIDTNLICDTQSQVESFMTHLKNNRGSVEAALEAVNGDEGSADACIIGTVAYRRGEEVGTVQSDEATLHVVRIEVVAVYTLNGFKEAEPTEAFTLLPDTEMPSTVGRR